MGILFYGKVCPLDAVEHHNIIGLGHPQFLIEAQSVLVVAGVHDDVVFAAGQPVKLLYQCGPDAAACIFPDNAQIRDEKPVGKIGNAEAHADDLLPGVSGHQADGRAGDQCADPLPEPFLGVLGTQIGVLEKINVFLS